MNHSRRLMLILALSAAAATTACAKKGPLDENGRPLEPLAIVTASGEHKFMVEIADDDERRQRGLMYRTTPQGPLTPRAEHMHASRFEAKTGTAEHGDTSHAYVHYKFSPKGVTWIAGLWGQHKAKLAQQVEV